MLRATAVGVDCKWTEMEGYVTTGLLTYYWAERSEAERQEDPTDVAWITAATSQADRLSALSGDNYVIFNGWH